MVERRRVIKKTETEVPEKTIDSNSGCVENVVAAISTSNETKVEAKEEIKTENDDTPTVKVSKPKVISPIIIERRKAIENPIKIDLKEKLAPSVEDLMKQLANFKNTSYLWINNEFNQDKSNIDVEAHFAKQKCLIKGLNPGVLAYNLVSHIFLSKLYPKQYKIPKDVQDQFDKCESVTMSQDLEFYENDRKEVYLPRVENMIQKIDKYENFSEEAKNNKKAKIEKFKIFNEQNLSFLQLCDRVTMKARLLQRQCNNFLKVYPKFTQYKFVDGNFVETFYHEQNQDSTGKYKFHVKFVYSDEVSVDNVFFEMEEISNGNYYVNDRKFRAKVLENFNEKGYLKRLEEHGEKIKAAQAKKKQKDERKRLHQEKIITSDNRENISRIKTIRKIIKLH